MREFKEIRKGFFGNTEAAKNYLGPARTLLGILKNQMQLGELSQLVRHYTLPDGVKISVQSIFGQDQVRIFVPQVERIKRKDEPVAHFTLWFQETVSRLVEFDPVSEKLTGRAIDLTSAGYGGAMLYAHGALWFKAGTVLSRVDVAKGEQKTFGGFGSADATFIAHEGGVLMLGKQGNDIVSLDPDGGTLATHSTAYEDYLQSARLVDDTVYWYGENVDLNKDIAKSFKLDSATGALTVVTEVTDIYSRRNTNYGGEGGANKCNLAYDRTSKKLHVKPYWADAYRPDEFDIWQASRGVVEPAAFMGGDIETVWNYAYSDYVATDGYYEQINADTIIPVADLGKYVVITGGYSGYGFGGETMGRARVYNSADNGESAHFTTTATPFISGLGSAVWDGGGKVWFIHPARSTPSTHQLMHININTAEIEIHYDATVLNYNQSIAVQPHVIGDDPDRTEMDWVMALQEASLH